MQGAGCKWVIGSFASIYVLALVILLIGVFGLFGQEKDPLSAVYLMPLGLPWVLWSDRAPDMMLPWMTVLAPALNLGILIAMCKAFRVWRGTEKLAPAACCPNLSARTRKEKLMGKTVSLMMGLVGGMLLGGPLIGGAAAGVGIATGTSAGICSTVQAAQEQPPLTAEQADRVVTRAAGDLSGLSGNDDTVRIVGVSATCECVLAQLREASAP